MRLAEIINETITPDAIDQISSMTDIHQARKAALDLMFANATPSERRADLRQQVQQAGRVKDLVQLLWSMKLSNEGLPTGINASKGKKGQMYRR